MPNTKRLRTCVATRTRCPDRELLRVCVDAAATERASAGAGQAILVIVPDPARKLGGRGAWVTPTKDMVDQAVSRRAFQRAFKQPGTVDVTRVLTFLSQSRQA